MLEHNAPSMFIANIDSPAQLAALVANPPAPSTSVIGPPPARGAAPVPGAPPAQPPNYPNGPQGIAAHSPAFWIKVSAQSDGTFTVTNSRNGFSKVYHPRNS
jgi:hypothetical protein